MIDHSDPRLTAYVLGELPEDELAAIERAIEASPELAQMVGEIRQTTAQLSEEFSQEDSLSLRADQKQQLLHHAEKRLTSHGTNQRIHGVLLNYWSWAAVAAAACLLAVMIQLPHLRFPQLAEQSTPQPTERAMEGELDDGDLADFADLSTGSELSQRESGETEEAGGAAREETITWSVPNGTSDHNTSRNAGLGLDGQVSEVDGERDRDARRQLFDLPGEDRDDVHENFESVASATPAEVTEELPRLSVSARPTGEETEAIRADDAFVVDGEVRVEAVEGTDIIILRGAKHDVNRVQTIIDGAERGTVDELFEDEELAVNLAKREALLEDETDPEASSPLTGPQGRFDVTIDQPSAIANLVAPGDKVDALVATDLDLVQDGKDHLSILEDVTVQSVTRDEKQTVVSFLVDAEERNRLELAEKLAPLQLELEKPGDGPDTAEATAEEISQRIEVKLQRERARAAKKQSWRRVKATPNTSRLMVGDKDELEMKGMQVNVQVDGFRARVMVDCFYFNDRNQQLEGTFKLRLPDDASLFYFAFGQSVYNLSPDGDLTDEEFLGGRLAVQPVSLRVENVQRARQGRWHDVKEARVVTREKAAFAYQQTVRRRVDPALVEWSGAGVFNARVFPLMPQRLHRIVIGYDVNLQQAKDAWSYTLQLPDQLGEGKVDVNVRHAGTADSELQSQSQFRTVKTSLGKHYRAEQPVPGDTIQLTVDRSGDVFLKSHDDRDGSFFASRITLDLPEGPTASSPRAVFLVDTSLSSQPDKFNVWLDLLRATLNNNRDAIDEFAVLFFNVGSQFWSDGFVANTPANVRRLTNDCQQLVLEGATDLYGAVQAIANTGWISEGSKPDVFLLSDGAANWGETNLSLIEQVLTANELGSVFAYQTGLSGTAIANLRFLSSATGGAVFSVANEDEIVAASRAHRTRPWRLVSLDCDEASDLLTAGRVQWLYPGQALTIVGRLEADAVVGPIQLQLERAGERVHVSVVPDAEVESNLASRLYGQVAVGQLERLGQGVADVASAYARHFRITGQTCSLLMLESEQDYRRFDIRPEEDLFVIQSRKADSVVRSTLKRNAEALADAKQQLLGWIERLEKMPGLEFSMPTALKLALEDVQIGAVSAPLRCQLTRLDQLSKDYVGQLSAETLNYDLIQKEAVRRSETSSDDAVKVLSSLVEQDPGNLVLARDVAFCAMEMNSPASAYHLLMRVARARPYQPSIYTALGQCLTQLGDADRAVLFYEIALGAKFQNTSKDFRSIAGTEYAFLLREITAKRRDSNIRDYAKARLASLTETLGVTESANLLVTMLWNTDRTDVDLHVVEPSGEECFYSHPATRSGGQLTQDITDGFGPEMYTIRKAPAGEYEILVKYYRTDPNRAGMRSKVYLTIYRDFGSGEESMIRKTINIKNAGHKELVETLRIK